MNKKEFNVTVHQTLYRTELIKTDDGDYINIDNTDWAKTFTLNRHYTALELIGIFQKYLENNKGSKYLIEECKSFSEENINYETC